MCKHFCNLSAHLFSPKSGRMLKFFFKILQGFYLLPRICATIISGGGGRRINSLIQGLLVEKIQSWVLFDLELSQVHFKGLTLIKGTGGLGGTVIV